MTAATQRIAYVRPDQVRVDIRAQRDIHPVKVRKMLAKFDPDLLGTVILSERADGSLYVIDGQHRIAVAQAANYQGTIPALIFTGLAVREEAQMFLGYQESSPPRTLEALRVKVEAGDEAAIEMADTLNRYGFTFLREPELRRVSAAGALQKGYRLGGATLLDRVFATIQSAWPSDETAPHGVIVLALATFLHRFPEVDVTRLARVLSADRPLTLVADIKAMKAIERLPNLDEAGARLVANLYNKGLRGSSRLSLVAAS